jgi:hypothetical protein
MLVSGICVGIASGEDARSGKFLITGIVPLFRGLKMSENADRGRKRVLSNKGSMFTVVDFNMPISGNIFHLYPPISWKTFPPINTVRENMSCPSV